MTLRERLTQLERVVQGGDDALNPWLDEQPIVAYDPALHETPEYHRGQAEWCRARADRCRARYPAAARWWERSAGRHERQLAKAIGQPVPPPADWYDAVMDGMDCMDARRLFPA